MTNLTEYLDEQLKLCEAATEGPWEWGTTVAPIPAIDPIRLDPRCEIYRAVTPFKRIARTWSVLDCANSAFIADSRTTTPKLIAALRVSEEALGRLCNCANEEVYNHCIACKYFIEISKILGVE